VRSAPGGLAVDAKRGVVTWAAGPGYLGTYRLSFEREDDQVLVDEPVRMHLDALRTPHPALRTPHYY